MDTGVEIYLAVVVSFIAYYLVVRDLRH